MLAKMFNKLLSILYLFTAVWNYGVLDSGLYL